MITNRYAGKCAVCAAHVKPNQGKTTKIGTRWAVYCAAHAPAEQAETPPRARGAHYYSPVTGAVAYRNPRGKCEDAPCCGCCT